MKRILLTALLIFGATVANAQTIPTPNKIITEGKIINKAVYGSTKTNVLLWAAYRGEIWRCSLYTHTEKPVVNAACRRADQRTSMDP